MALKICSVSLSVFTENTLYIFPQFTSTFISWLLFICSTSCLQISKHILFSQACLACTYYYAAWCIFSLLAHLVNYNKFFTSYFIIIPSPLSFLSITSMILFYILSRSPIQRLLCYTYLL